MSPNPQATLLRLQKSLALAVMLTGVSLSAVFASSLFGFQNISYRVLWHAHLLVHIAAMTLSMTLLIHLAKELNSGSTLLYLLMFFAACGLIISSTFLPWSDHHAVTFELPLARWWAGAGAMTDLPWIEKAALPGGIIPVYVGFFIHRLSFLLSAYVASYVLVVAGLLAALVFYKTHDEELSLWACLVYMTNPFIVAGAGQPSNVLPAALFFGLAYGAAILWGEQRARFFWLVIPGLALGFGCLLSAAMFLLGAALCLGLFGFYLGWKFPLKRVFGAIAAILFAAFIGSSLWLFRSFLWSGGLPPIFGRPSWGEAAPSIVVEWGLGCALVLLALIPVFRRSRNLHRVAPWGRATWFTALAGAVLSWVYYTHDVSEILIPLLLPMILLAAVGLEQLIERKQGNKGPRYMRASLALHLLLVLCSGILSQGVQRSLEFFFGRINRAEYLEETVDGYSLTRAANQLIPAGSGVFVVGAELPLYYLKKSIIGISERGESLNQLLGEEKTAQNFARRLLLQGVTHLIVRSSEKENLPKLSESQRQIWHAFLRDFTVRISEAEGRKFLRIENVPLA